MFPQTETAGLPRVNITTAFFLKSHLAHLFKESGSGESSAHFTKAAALLKPTKLFCLLALSREQISALDHERSSNDRKKMTSGSVSALSLAGNNTRVLGCCSHLPGLPLGRSTGWSPSLAGCAGVSWGLGIPAGRGCRATAKPCFLKGWGVTVPFTVACSPHVSCSNGDELGCHV